MCVYVVCMSERNVCQCKMYFLTVITAKDLKTVRQEKIEARIYQR